VIVPPLDGPLIGGGQRSVLAENFTQILPVVVFEVFVAPFHTVVDDADDDPRPV